MTFSDNSNALLLKRKMARRTNSQYNSSPCIQSTSQNRKLSKEKNIKSHSDCKRLYRSNDNKISEYVNSESRKKTSEEIEFEKKIYQLNCLKGNSPIDNEFNHVNYSFDDEVYETNAKHFNQKNDDFSLINRKRVNPNDNNCITRQPLIYNQTPNKLTNWNDVNFVENNEDQTEKDDIKISKSILKSFNMYRF